jgi:hypothetical protein
MLRLTGEIADGLILWLCTPAYIRGVVVPEPGAGRERTGRGLDDFRVVAAVPSALTDDATITGADFEATLRAAAPGRS